MWHGYFLIKKPAAWLPSDFALVCDALAHKLGNADVDPQPSNRMQTRVNLAGDAEILEAVFNPADLDPRDLAHLCKYISDVIPGKVNPAQVRTALTNNTLVFGGDGSTLELSRAACADYLASNRATWDLVL